MLWQVYVFPIPRQPDLEARRIEAEIVEFGFEQTCTVRFARGYLIEGGLNREDMERIGRELLADPVIEAFAINDENPTCHSLPARRDSEALTTHQSTIANVLLKPGVMDPVAQSVEQAIRQLGLQVSEVHTFRRYWIAGVDGQNERDSIAKRVLANDAIEQVIWGPLKIDQLAHGGTYRFDVIRFPIRTMTDSELERVSRDGQLSLCKVEMQTIQRHFREIGRDPTDAELETLAQTWSEHCSHKTLRGRIDYEEIDADGRVSRREHFENLLKETIFKATQDIRAAWGPQRDWCVSVFEDNAGIVRFDDQFNVCFKVETHNHPSAIEPYGGANTGVGGVIRDVIGTGLGAKPIANTDIFCFAPPDWGQGSGVRGQEPGVGGQESGTSGSPLTTHHSPLTSLPPGVLHPKRVMKGVVAGVRDYGNRMGIPTVNGAIYFDDRYLGNPLVFCGSVGLIPRDRSKKQPRLGDLIVAVGGRTGRDGIHGATFSSIELTHESEQLSGGAVQIGNAITEKMMLDVILEARDRGLYHAITDCGAGGFSSAVGEMGEKIGAEVWLEKAPLKYQGLSDTEIWISEAQERMVLAVPESSWPEFDKLARSEGVEATVIGRFVATGRLTLKYENHVVGDLDMHFLHKGRPPVVRKAVYRVQGTGFRVQGSGVKAQKSEVRSQEPARPATDNGQRTTDSSPLTTHPSPLTSCEPPFNEALRRILSSWNVCSKEWVIRQYDHEVQGGSVIKPLVGAANDGPSDAAVIRPVLSSYRGLAIACGMNPRYGDIDPYWMAASAIDEAIRNCVAVGADPDRIAILDNFCWGNTDRPEELGSLVRATMACRDIATAYGTPFISGKDSLNNEFRLKAEGRGRRAESQISNLKSQISNGDRIVIPPTILISAIGQIDDVRTCVTMDLKCPDNRLYLIGFTANEFGGSHYALVSGQSGGRVPVVQPELARDRYRRVHEAIRQGLVCSCHDLSEGGLAVGLAEMALAGGLGANIDLIFCHLGWFDLETFGEPKDPETEQLSLLFAESNSRFILEVPLDRDEAFQELMDRPGDMPHTEEGFMALDLGFVTTEPNLAITDMFVRGRGSNGDPGRSAKIPPLISMPISDLKECWQRPLRW